MAYSKLDGTYLYFLPYDIQDYIEELITKSKFDDVKHVMINQLHNFFPETGTLVTENPTKYQRLIHEITEIIMNYSTNLMGTLSVAHFISYLYKLILTNYKYSTINGYMLDRRGEELFEYFYKVNAELSDNTISVYDKYKIIQRRLVKLEYQELLQFKKMLNRDIGAQLN